jgi:ribosome-associated protein
MPDAVRVDDTLTIPGDELTIRATRAGGPGGQHVNTSSTRIELLWNVAESRVLDDARRARLMSRLTSRLDAEGRVRIVAAGSRSQRQNRMDAERRLAELVRRGLAAPRKRIATRPPRASKERRLSEKKHRGERKRNRKRVDDD